MKKSIIFSAMAMLLVAVMISFTSVKGKHVAKPVHKKAAFTCNAGVTGLTYTISGSTVTFSWSGVNSPAYYRYGGYYQSGGQFSGTVYGTSFSMPYNTGRFGVTAVCSDGTTGGSQNTLY